MLTRITFGKRDSESVAKNSPSGQEGWPRFADGVVDQIESEIKEKELLQNMPRASAPTTPAFGHPSSGRRGVSASAPPLPRWGVFR